MKRKRFQLVSVYMFILLLLAGCSFPKLGKKGKGDEDGKASVSDAKTGDDGKDVTGDNKADSTESEYYIPPHLRKTAEYDPDEVDRGKGGDPDEIARLEDEIAGKLWIREGDEPEYMCGWLFTEKHTVVRMGRLGFNDAYYDGIWYVTYGGDYGYDDDSDEVDESSAYRLAFYDGSPGFDWFIINFTDDGKLNLKRFYDDSDSDGFTFYVDPEKEPALNVPENAGNPDEFVEIWQLTEVGADMDTLSGNNTPGNWLTIKADGSVYSQSPFGDDYMHWACTDDVFYLCYAKERQKEAPYPFDDVRYSIRPFKYEKIDAQKYLFTDMWDGHEYWLQCR